jgi:hypothetical protein
MKKCFLLFIVTLMITGTLFAQVKKGSPAWVSAKTVELKSSTGFFASVRGTLQLGAEVSVLQVNGNWAEVRSLTNSSLSGWTAVSSLSARKIVSSGTSASASEVAMAGKGFSQEVEDVYKTEGSLNYADVDRTEAITVSRDDLYAFVTEGHLSTGE